MENTDKTNIMVYIKNIETDEIVKYIDWVYNDNDGKPSMFMWTDGNYSCDCNRYLFFHRALGINEYCIEDIQCNHENKYLVCIKDQFDKEVYYSEF